MTKYENKEIEGKQKYCDKMKAMEEHYEKVIKKLVEDLNTSKSYKFMKGEGTKSNNDIKRLKSNNSRLSTASNKIWWQQDGEKSWGEELETDLTPADEMSVTERYKLTERKDNINNDSLLTSFYKRKIEDKRTTEMTSSHQRLHSQHQEDNKKLTQRTNASLKYRPENHKPSDSLSNNICFI